MGKFISNYYFKDVDIDEPEDAPRRIQYITNTCSCLGHCYDDEVVIFVDGERYTSIKLEGSEAKYLIKGLLMGNYVKAQENKQ